MIVKQDFYCVIEQKQYTKGEQYTGKRLNLFAYVDYEPKETKKRKLPKLENK